MSMSADEDPARPHEVEGHAAPDEAQPWDSPEEARARRLLWDIGFCGQYLHFHSGGRSGRAAIICLIAKSGGQMSQQELGAYFELKPGSLSEILAKIESAGLIERTRNPEDRRQLSGRPDPGARHGLDDRVHLCLVERPEGLRGGDGVVDGGVHGGAAGLGHDVGFGTGVCHGRSSHRRPAVVPGPVGCTDSTSA